MTIPGPYVDLDTSAIEPDFDDGVPIDDTAEPRYADTDHLGDAEPISVLDQADEAAS